MLKLTDKQVEAAVEAYYEAGPTPTAWKTAPPATKYRIGEQLRAAAPFLQAAWEMSSDEEAEALHGGLEMCGRDLYGCGIVLNAFLDRRNFLLLPKPVDPRRATIMRILRDGWHLALGVDGEIADRILAAIDGKIAALILCIFLSVVASAQIRPVTLPKPAPSTARPPVVRVVTMPKPPVAPKPAVARVVALPKVEPTVVVAGGGR